MSRWDTSGSIPSTGLTSGTRQTLGKQAAEIAVALLDAKPAKGGKMRAVLDPELAGVFAHEAVGHASEGDLIAEGSSVLKGTDRREDRERDPHHRR